MADSPRVPNASKVTSGQLKALTKYLPGLMNVTNAQMLPSELARLGAAQATAPGFADVGVNAERIAREGSARTDAGILAGTGRRSIEAALANEQLINPEFYAGRAATGNKLMELLNSYNMNGLSGGEAAAVERATGRDNAGRGNLGVGSPLTTVNNAMNFGDRFQQKQDSLTRAIGTAAGSLGSFKSGIDTTQVALGRPSGVAPGQFANTGNNSIIDKAFDTTGQAALQHQSIVGTHPGTWEQVSGTINGALSAY